MKKIILLLILALFLLSACNIQKEDEQLTSVSITIKETEQDKETLNEIKDTNESSYIKP